MTGLQTPRTDAATRWEARLEPYHVVIVFAAALLIRLWVIHTYPIIFGGDSIVRLYYHDRILISHQLPALQAAVHLIMGLANDPVWVRYFMAVAGAAASAGFYHLCACLLGRTAAFPPAVWFTIHPFVVAYSTVPYQEILMLTGLFFGFSCFFRERWQAATSARGAGGQGARRRRGRGKPDNLQRSRFRTKGNSAISALINSSDFRS